MQKNIFRAHTTEFTIFKGHPVLCLKIDLWLRICRVTLYFIGRFMAAGQSFSLAMQRGTSRPSWSFVSLSLVGRHSLPTSKLKSKPYFFRSSGKVAKCTSFEILIEVRHKVLTKVRFMAIHKKLYSNREVAKNWTIAAGSLRQQMELRS